MTIIIIIIIIIMAMCIIIVIIMAMCIVIVIIMAMCIIHCPYTIRYVNAIVSDLQEICVGLYSSGKFCPV